MADEIPSLFQNLQIDVNGLARTDELEFDGHPKRYKKLRLASLIIFLCLLMLPWLIPLLMGNEVLLYTGMPLWLIFASLMLLEELKGYPVRGYAVREHDITYKKGYLKYSLTTIPFTRIQHSEITQGPLGRAFYLSTLNIYTAGGSSSDLKISGLDPEVAQKLRDFIAEKIGSHD